MTRIDPLPEGYTSEQIGSARVIARDGALELVRDALSQADTLYGYAARHPQATVLQGRGPLYVVPATGPERWVVRHLRHGGLLAPITRDRFLRTGRRRPFNELRISCRLRHLGIPTPEVTAAIVYPAGIFYRGDVARQEVPEARDLASCLFGAPELDEADRIAAITAAARMLRWLHTDGVIHPDLNLRNILLEWLGRPPRPYILDLEKCRIVDRVSDAHRVRMLRRFQRSARKFERQTGATISDHEWDCFHTAYQEYQRG